MGFAQTLPQPSIGRIVHFRPIDNPQDTSATSTCQAAIITAVRDPAGDAGGGIVDLAVFAPHGTEQTQNVSYVKPDAGCAFSWHWPERID